MEYIYHPPTLTVDAVIFRIQAGELQVLLIKRANEPFAGHWALPGGYNAAGDTTMQALERVLRTKVGISPTDLPVIEQLRAFDTIARDPRGHAVSVAYMGLGYNLQLHTTETTHTPTFWPVNDLPDMAYDHADIIAFALKRLRASVTTTGLLFALLPLAFTLTQLQTAYEVVLGKTLDKRNFRKKILSLDVLDLTGDTHQDGAHRPAQLYRFRRTDYDLALSSF